MTNKAEVCGWQPKGDANLIPRPSKFGTAQLSIEKLQADNKKLKNALTEMKTAFGGATFIDSKNMIHSVNKYVSDVVAATGGENEN
ncbi:hypothetical protein LL14B4_06130 [Lactococcus lactis subsp. lactis]|uniref:Uncharacterized protein n=1 Tax=Lactococcus lactis subsp. lactis TaxID=1360 RepID=A0A2Z3KEA0_LACLL|nr:hypothetical protein [Lactococcus lactis]AWN65777.1 hypothetical protein LL14B4_06130 [Lactococcus lactis subsp. lactis]